MIFRAVLISNHLLVIFVYCPDLIEKHRNKNNVIISTISCVILFIIIHILINLINDVVQLNLCKKKYIILIINGSTKYLC